MQRCILLGALLCVLQTGCQTPAGGSRLPAPLLGAGLPTTSARQPVAENRETQGESQASQKELPSDEAAKVSFAAAEALEKAGKNKEAIALYERARKLDSRYQHVCRRLGVLHDKEGNYFQAQKEYMEALRQSPRDANLFNDVGYSHYCQGKWAEAETALKQALLLDPKNQRAWINLGMAQAQQEKYEEAMEAWGKVVTPGQAQCNLGFILTTQGKREEAKESYRRALEMEPGLQIAKTAIYKLENPGAGKEEAEAKKKGPKDDRRYVLPHELLYQSTQQQQPPQPSAIGLPGLAPVPTMTPGPEANGSTPPVLPRNQAMMPMPLK